MQQTILGRILAGTGSETHLLEKVQSINRSDLPGADRARVRELFRHVDHVSGQ